jgi:hypothetical protein
MSLCQSVARSVRRVNRGQAQLLSSIEEVPFGRRASRLHVQRNGEMRLPSRVSFVILPPILTSGDSETPGLESKSLDCNGPPGVFN